ncbi:hypothetical protein HJC99_03635 [Candidatus Saccharibacteria bacterium]|nr:hypothetical protein [Candidatus Saccharibacteria bacterium]
MSGIPALPLLAGVQITTLRHLAPDLGPLLPLALEVRLFTFLDGPLATTDPTSSYSLSDDWSVRYNDALVWLIYAPEGGMTPDDVDAFLQEHGLGAKPEMIALVLPYTDADSDTVVSDQLWHNSTYRQPWRTGLEFRATSRSGTDFNVQAPAE